MANSKFDWIKLDDYKKYLDIKAIDKNKLSIGFVNVNKYNFRNNCVEPVVEINNGPKIAYGNGEGNIEITIHRELDCDIEVISKENKLFVSIEYNHWILAGNNCEVAVKSTTSFTANTVKLIKNVFVTEDFGSEY